MNSELKVAIDFYLKKGWNIIPCDFKKAVLKKDKVEKQVSFPIDYAKYHTEKVTKELTDSWWEKSNGIAIITGQISGITVMDIDTKTLKEIIDLPHTFTVETNKGFHFYFKYKKGIGTRAKSYSNAFNIDVRNDGGIIYAPPSSYELPDGEKTKYKIIDNSPLAEFPVAWGENIEKKYAGKNQKNNWKNKIMESIPTGTRNSSFASIIGGMLQRFPQDDWYSIVWTLVQSENKAQADPLEEYELRTIFNSIAKEELRKRSVGGEIKDISTGITDDEIRIEITLEKAIVCFKAKNIASNILEGNVVTWLKKASGLSHEIDFYFKLNSDSNKEQWARILGRAFDKKDEKETYPWTILINKVSAELEKIIRSRQQDFKLNEIVPKDITWMLEPFIQEDQVNTLFGMGASGKTMLAMYFSTLTAEQGVKTLFIDYENDSSGWAGKMKQLTSLDEHFIYYDSEQIPLIEQVEKIKQTIKKHNIKLVIVDSASLASGDSTSDEKAALKLFAGLKLLKTTIVLIAHQRKNEGDKNPIGSVQYENQARNVWNIASERDGVEDSTLHLACKHTKANNTYLRKNPIGFKITFGSKITIEREDAIENFEDKFTVITRIEKLLTEDKSMLAKDIATVLNVSIGSIKKNLTIGKNRGKFININESWSLAQELDKSSVTPSNLW